MFEQQPEDLRFYVKQLATDVSASLNTRALQSSEPSAWFEVLYAKAKGDTAQIPWAKLTPHPDLQDWLTNHELFTS